MELKIKHRWEHKRGISMMRGSLFIFPTLRVGRMVSDIYDDKRRFNVGYYVEVGWLNFRYFGEHIRISFCGKKKGIKVKV